MPSYDIFFGFAFTFDFLTYRNDDFYTDLNFSLGIRYSFGSRCASVPDSIEDSDTIALAAGRLDVAPADLLDLRLSGDAAYTRSP